VSGIGGEDDEACIDPNVDRIVAAITFCILECMSGTASVGDNDDVLDLSRILTEPPIVYTVTGSSWAAIGGNLLNTAL
jgi:hypothetical protein